MTAAFVQSELTRASDTAHIGAGSILKRQLSLRFRILNYFYLFFLKQ